MSRKIFKLVAWASLAVIVFATLSPLGLRPHLGGVSIERFGAFALTGLLFGLAYPTHIWLVSALVLGAAVGLEIAQHLTPDRHGEVRDAIVKFVGGAFGIGLSVLLDRVFWVARPLPQGTGLPKDVS